ncbi:MAG TPA: ice-binding family protein [Candidatus Saccharimonadales bacterium]|nr:ice-binding family protein [Candidatus Saccharimonadales bacterium]
MKRFNRKLLFSAAVAVFTLVVAGPINVLAATSPTLGTVGSYSVLGNTTVTNTGNTTMPGDLGISIGGAPVGFPPGVVGPPGTIRNAGDSLAAQNADTAAFGYIDQGCDTTYTGTFKDLVGLDLVAGVYCADAFQLSGTLTLSGTGVWIFKSASTLTTSGTANVIGGDSCSVWWREVSSATLGTNTSLTGNVLASTSISLQTGASLNGRALAQTGAVTLDNNTLTGSTCLTPSTFGGTGSTTPKLPNTGSGPQQNNSTSMWAFGISAAVVMVLLSFVVVRKKRVN